MCATVTPRNILDILELVRQNFKEALAQVYIVLTCRYKYN